MEPYSVSYLIFSRLLKWNHISKSVNTDVSQLHKLSLQVVRKKV